MNNDDSQLKYGGGLLLMGLLTVILMITPGAHAIALATGGCALFCLFKLMKS